MKSAFSQKIKSKINISNQSMLYHPIFITYVNILLIYCFDHCSVLLRSMLMTLVSVYHIFFDVSFKKSFDIKIWFSWSTISLLFIIRTIRIIVLLLCLLVDVSTGVLQWRQLASSDLPDGPMGRTSPSNVLYRDSIIMYGGAVSYFLIVVADNYFLTKKSFIITNELFFYLD